MRVQIQLLSYDYAAELPKTFIMTTLEGSLLAQALEYEPDVTVIPLSHPVVTPRVLNGLVEMATLKNPRVGPKEHHPDFVAASSYLNLPWLQSFSDPLYNAFPDKLDVNNPHNQALLLQILREDRHHLYSYLLERGLRPTDEHFKTAIQYDARRIFQALQPESTWLLMAVEAERPALVEIILRRGVEPRFLSAAVHIAIRSHHNSLAKDLFRRLQSVNDTDFDPEFDKKYHCNMKLQSAIKADSEEMVDFLLGQPIVDPAIKINTTPGGEPRPIIEATRQGNEKIVARLLKDPRVDPSVENNRALQMALDARCTKVVNLLMNDPRVNPNYRLHRGEDALADTCNVM